MNLIDMPMYKIFMDIMVITLIAFYIFSSSFRHDAQLIIEYKWNNLVKEAKGEKNGNVYGNV